MDLYIHLLYWCIIDVVHTVNHFKFPKPTFHDLKKQQQHLSLIREVVEQLALVLSFNIFVVRLST